MGFKVSVGQFYHEVTGSNTSNWKTTVAALNRWGVPTDGLKPRTRCIDVELVEAAKLAYRAEREAQALRREKATEVAARKANGTTPPDTPLLKLCHGHTADLAFLREAIMAQSAAIDRLEDTCRRLLALWESPRSMPHGAGAGASSGRGGPL